MLVGFQDDSGRNKAKISSIKPDGCWHNTVVSVLERSAVETKLLACKISTTRVS